MKCKEILVGCLLAVFLASCASPLPRNKDLAADEALGTAGYEEEATEAEQALQETQKGRQQEQRQALERQITDPRLR